MQSAFSLGRITKSGAVFDKAKLSWMNGESGPICCVACDALCRTTRWDCHTVHHMAAVHAAGQYLRTKPDEELIPQLAGQWAAAGLIKSDDATPFVTAAVQAAKKSLVSSAHDANLEGDRMAHAARCRRAGGRQVTRLLCCTLQEVLPDADAELRSYLGYPLEETLGSDAAKEVVDDDFAQVAQAAVQAYESGALKEALQEGPDGFKVHAALASTDHCQHCNTQIAPWRRSHVIQLGSLLQKWLKGVGKDQKRKGKRLFMPMRIALTVRMSCTGYIQLLVQKMQAAP